MIKSKITALFLLVLTTQTVYGVDSCRALLSSHEMDMPGVTQHKYPKLSNSQPTQIRINQQTLLVHNHKLAEILKTMTKAPDSAELKPLIQLLYQNETFHFPLTEDGFLPAANNGDHHGGYGSYVWLRDLARASSGVSAMPKLLKNINQPDSVVTQSMAHFNAAKLRIFSEREQIVRTLKNILNP